MAKFFKTIDDLRKYIGVTKAYNLAGFETREEYAIEQYLVNWIGATQLNALATAYGDDTLTPAQELLLPKIQMSLANLGFYEHIPFLEVSILDSGIQRTENEQSKTAYSGQIESLKAAVLIAGYNSLETCLAFLEANVVDFPLWAASTGYTQNKANFINTALIFNNCYPIEMSRLAFKSMTPFMNDAEAFEIQPHIGKAFFDELKAAILGKSTTTEQDYVISIIQKAVANFTIALATSHGWASYTVNAVVQKEYNNPDNGNKLKVATNEAVSHKITEANAAGARWRSKLMSHLRANADDFATFTNDVTVNPESTAGENPCNAPRKSFFYS